jgi:uncharacterized SAM-binding protein YcdF (DUF218 family)
MKSPRIKKILKIVGIFLLFILLIVSLRRPLMRSVGNYLIDEDQLRKADAIFVLSGNPGDRAKEAAKLFTSGFAPMIICTGESVPTLFEVINVKMDEATLSEIALKKEKVDSNKIEVIHEGTSTREESHVILRYCKQNGLKKIIVVSDKFHTNRINYAFRSIFEKGGIEVILRGAPSSGYKEDNWWAEEAGLLMVNNEYVKLFYYYIHY